MNEEAADACGGWLEDGRVHQHERQDDHDDACAPGDEVKSPGIRVLAHQVFTVD